MVIAKTTDGEKSIFLPDIPKSTGQILAKIN